jgi:hypothetical protein
MKKISLYIIPVLVGLILLGASVTFRPRKDDEKRRSFGLLKISSGNPLQGHLRA